MNYLDYFILGAILVGMVVLAAPISFEFDSTERRIKFAWLGLTITRRLEGQKRERAPKKTKKRWKTRGLAMLRRLCQGRDLVWELVERVGRFGLEVFRGSPSMTPKSGYPYLTLCGTGCCMLPSAISS